MIIFIISKDGQKGKKLSDATSIAAGEPMKMWENLELSGLRRAREGNHVADVLHTCYEEHQTLETESEA